jgi:inner membrane protein
MDNLTHTLTGVMLARAGLNKLTPRATLLMILAANAPNIDVVSSFYGPAVNLDVHRGYTHAWVFAPLLAAVAVLLTRPFARGATPFPWMKAWLAATIGVASHILFDWTNSYGVRFFLPFNDHWYRLDSTFQADPWILAVLLLAIAGPALSRLVSQEIGARKTAGAGAARVALILIVSYDIGRLFLHERAIAELSSRVFDGQAPKRVAAFATLVNPLHWRAVAELREGYWTSDVRLNREFDPTDGRTYYQAEPRPEIQAALRARVFDSLARFDQFPLWRVSPMSEPEGAMKVELYDLRFGNPVSPGFVATAIVQNSRVLEEDFQFGQPRISGR